MATDVEIWVDGDGSVAADGGVSGKLSSEEIQVVQSTVTNLIVGFQPAAPPVKSGGMGLEAIELELGFKIEGKSGGILKLLLVDAKASATIKAKVTWKKA